MEEILKRLEALEKGHKEKEEGEQKKRFFDKYGAMFSGDEGIGTAILAELNRSGIDTSLADQAVQDMLTALRDEYSSLLDKIHVDTKKLEQQASDAMDTLTKLSDAIEKTTGTNPKNETNPTGEAMSIVDQASGGAPPPPAPTGGMDDGSAVMQATSIMDQNAGMPPPDAGMPPSDAGMAVSDRRLKDMKEEDGGSLEGTKDVDSLEDTLREIADVLRDNGIDPKRLEALADEATSSDALTKEEPSAESSDKPIETEPSEIAEEELKDEEEPIELEEDEEDFDLYDSLNDEEIDTEMVDMDGDDEADYILQEIYKPDHKVVKPDGSEYEDEEEEEITDGK